MAIGVAVLVIGLFFLWRWWRARRRRRAPAPSLEAACLAELARLRAADDFSRAGERRLHYALSELVRRYLEGRYHFPATDLTTEEIDGRLAKDRTLLAADRERWAALLRETDTVKFAEATLGRATAQRLLDQAEALIRAGQPVAEPAAPAPEAPA